jgi:hypothetical protein
MPDADSYDRHPAISVFLADRHLGNPLFPGKRSLTSGRSIVPLFAPARRTSDYLCWLVTGPLNLNGPYQICEVAMAVISGQSLKCRHKKFNKGDKYDNTAHNQKI